MVIKNGCLEVDASEKAAESQGFAAKWSGRNVRAWTVDGSSLENFLRLEREPMGGCTRY
jgi:hypothetical protein